MSPEELWIIGAGDGAVDGPGTVCVLDFVLCHSYLRNVKTTQGRGEIWPLGSP